MLRERISLDIPHDFRTSGTACPFHLRLHILKDHDLTVTHPKGLVWVVCTRNKSGYNAQVKASSTTPWG